jgi:hypothetical protein
MNLPEVDRVVLCAMLTSLVACASVLDTPRREWRRERVVRISAASSLPPYVDTHCLSDLPTGGAEALLLHFRVGHATYYQAFPFTQGVAWTLGDYADFVSDSCEIRRVEPSPEQWSRSSSSAVDIG